LTIVATIDCKGRVVRMFPDIVPGLAEKMPELRGQLVANGQLKTTFRVGGPAQVLFRPQDEDDLRYFLTKLPAEIPVTVNGRGSNLLVRDGGVRGVVIRLGQRFREISVDREQVRILAGAAAPDQTIAHLAMKAGIGGLSFLRGIPGMIGGAVRMNAGTVPPKFLNSVAVTAANATASNATPKMEIKDVLVEARAIDRSGGVHRLSNSELEFDYRHCGAPADFIFTQVLLQGVAGDVDEIGREMTRVVNERLANEPTEPNAGSTFKNPDNLRAWELIQKARCQGQRIGGAEVSNKHANFLINRSNATADDIEALGELVRRRVRESSGIDLKWEIERIGEPLAAVRSN
jgi:UDP-N-acetylmuramate dehydrogenase